MALIQKDANADLITLAAKSNPIAFFATDQAAQDAYDNGEIPEGTIVFTEEEVDNNRGIYKLHTYNDTSSFTQDPYITLTPVTVAGSTDTYYEFTAPCDMHIQLIGNLSLQGVLTIFNSDNWDRTSQGSQYNLVALYDGLYSSTATEPIVLSGSAKLLRGSKYVIRYTCNSCKILTIYGD
jgi:hypothetical protein